MWHAAQVEILKKFTYTTGSNKEHFEWNIWKKFREKHSKSNLSLLKGGVTEASLLRSAHSYADHPEKQLDQLARMLRIIPESSNHLDRPIRHFYKRMADIKPTATELGILVALRTVLKFKSWKNQMLLTVNYLLYIKTLQVCSQQIKGWL